MMSFEQEHKTCIEVWKSLQIHLNANTKEMQKKMTLNKTKRKFGLKIDS